MRLELDACLSTAEWFDKWFRSRQETFDLTLFDLKMSNNE